MINVLEVPIFGTDILVAIGVDKPELVKHIGKKLKYKLSEEELSHLTMYGAGRTVQLNGGQIVVWVDHKAKKGDPILVHELIHACNFMFERLGIKYDDELHAYLMQFLVSQVNLLI